MPPGAIPFPFGKCRICKDRATGVHYGVATCEGCKGFFKRSITKAEKYKCFFGGSCDVTPKNRNRCKSCRFRLCLEHGMSVEAVRMGRIPKVEKEKALEAVKSSGEAQTDEPYQQMDEEYEKNPGYLDQQGSYAPPTASAACPGSLDPNMYDFDTGCVSRQNQPVADDRERRMSETVTKLPDKDQRPFEKGIISAQSEASAPITQTQVKKEFDASELTSSCHFSQHNNKSSLEIHDKSKVTVANPFEHDKSKVTVMNPFEKQSDTYQYYNYPGVNRNPSDQLETNSMFTKNQHCTTKNMFSMNNRYQPHSHHSSDVSRSHVQGQVPNMVRNQCTSNINPYHDKNRYSNTPMYGNASQWRHTSETGFYGHREQVNRNLSDSMATSMTLTPGSYKGSSHDSGQGQGQGMNMPTYHENNPPNNSFENHPFKSEPMDMNFPDDFQNYERETMMAQNKNNVAAVNKPDAPQDNIQSWSVQLGQSAPPTNVQSNAPQLKVSYPSTSDISQQDRSPSVMSSSFPPTCPTPSIDGSTTSSQRGRFSPALIKVLLEQVLDSTQDSDVTLRLQQRLEKSCVDKGVVANVLNLIREVSAKRNKAPGSEETNILSSAESCSGKSASLAESKMENIQRFLEDVNKFSRPGSLFSPPPFNNDSTFNCSPIKKRLLSIEYFPGLVEKTYESMRKNGLNATPSDPGKSVCITHTESEKMVAFCSSKMEASCLSNPEQSTKYPMPEVNLKWREQSETIESSQLEERPTVSQNSPPPCDLINQSINENEVTCSDDKLSKEEVKKQVIQMTLEGMSFASKILNRIKPERREQLRLWKSGLLKMRVLPTDTEEEMAETYQKIIAAIEPLNERVLGFCEQVPGFSNISAEDRIILLKRAYYDIWMLTSAEYFTENSVNIITMSGEIYNRKAMEKILNKEITATLMDFASQFNRLNLSDLEITILCAVRLTCSDHLEVKDKPTIQKLHSLMLDVLAVEIEQNHPDNHTRLLITLFELMPLLESTNKAQRQIIASFPVNRHGSSKDKKKQENKMFMVKENEVQYSIDGSEKVINLT